MHALQLDPKKHVYYVPILLFEYCLTILTELVSCVLTLSQIHAINAGRRAPSNDNSARRGGQMVSIGSVTIQIQGSGNSEEDGEEAARAFTRTVRRIAREEMEEQGRDGGILTTTSQSVLTG